MIELLATIVFSYLVGSFPTSIIVGKIFKGIDIREHGSGNAGATNVLRVMGWKLGVAVLLIDVGKGIVATLFVAQLAFGHTALSDSVIQIITGSCAVVGHIYTIFAGFRGGKGVGTAAGMIFSLYPIPAIFCALIFFITVATTRFVSLGSITAAALLPIILLISKYLFHVTVETSLLFFAVFIVSLIIFAHRGNIKKLLNGTENRFGRTSRSD